MLIDLLIELVLVALGAWWAWAKPVRRVAIPRGGCDAERVVPGEPRSGARTTQPPDAAVPGAADSATDSRGAG